MPPDKLIKWEILDPARRTKVQAEVNGRARSDIPSLHVGVLAVASLNPQVGDWEARVGVYAGNSLQNEAAKVAKQGTKLPRLVAGAIFGPMVMDLNVVRMKSGAEPYRWRE